MIPSAPDTAGSRVPPPSSSITTPSITTPPPITTPPAPRIASPDNKTGLLHSLQSLVYILVIAIFILTFCVQPFRIPSGSMEPTLLIGDFLLVNKQSAGHPDNFAGLLPSSRIRRGEIIVFHYPVKPEMHLIKRVVGLPGDHLKLRAGHVYINGSALPESYAVYRPSGPDAFRDNFPRLDSADPDIDSRWWIHMRNLIDNGELIIPSGNYFVLGDNRNDSEDSRYWGFVPRADIVGEPLLIYFSLRQGGVDADPLSETSANQAVPSGTRPSTLTAEATSTRLRPGRFDALADFARWSRTLQIVR